MKAILCAIPLMLAFCVVDAQAADMKKPDAAAPAGTEGSWTGTLGAAQGKGVAVMHVKADKEKKSDVKELVLWADSDTLKTQIEEALKKHSTVQVSGMLAAGTTDVKVASLTVEDKKKGKTK